MADRDIYSPPVEGVRGEYVGPAAGSTPAGDADLHTSDNPYKDALGSPGYDLNRPSTFRPGSQYSHDNLLTDDVVRQSAYDVAQGYFANPPAAGGNPHAAASAPTKFDVGDRAAADAMAVGLAATYDHLIAEQHSAHSSHYFGDASQTNPTPPASPAGEYFHRMRVDEGVDEQVIPLPDRR